MPRVTCPSCSQRGKISPTMVGLPIRCKKCGTGFNVLRQPFSGPRPPGQSNRAETPSPGECWQADDDQPVTPVVASTPPPGKFATLLSNLVVACLLLWGGYKVVGWERSARSAGSTGTSQQTSAVARIMPATVPEASATPRIPTAPVALGTQPAELTPLTVASNNPVARSVPAAVPKASATPALPEASTLRPFQPTPPPQATRNMPANTKTLPAVFEEGQLAEFDDVPPPVLESLTKNQEVWYLADCGLWRGKKNESDRHVLYVVLGSGKNGGGNPCLDYVLHKKYLRWCDERLRGRVPPNPMSGVSWVKSPAGKSTSTHGSLTYQWSKYCANVEGDLPLDFETSQVVGKPEEIVRPHGPLGP